MFNSLEQNSLNGPQDCNKHPEFMFDSLKLDIYSLQIKCKTIIFCVKCEMNRMQLYRKSTSHNKFNCIFIRMENKKT